MADRPPFLPAQDGTSTPPVSSPFQSAAAAATGDIASHRRPSHLPDRSDSNQLAVPVLGQDLDKGRVRRARAARGLLRDSSSGAPSRTAAQRRKASGAASAPVAGGFLPRLARVVEGREVDDKRRGIAGFAADSPRDKPASSARQRTRTQECPPASSRRSSRLRQSSLQHHIGSLANLSNPSLLSIVSGLTNSSSGSNSTITQKSYNKSLIAKRKQSKERKAKRGVSQARQSRANRAAAADCIVPSCDVFQYLQEPSKTLGAPMADIDTNGSISTEEGGESSDSEVPDHAEEDSPPSSPPPPCSPMKQRHGDNYLENGHSDSGISVRGSSPEQQDFEDPSNPPPPSLPRANEAVDEEEDSSEEEEGDEGDEDEEDDEEDDEKRDNEEPNLSHALQKIRFSLPEDPQNRHESPAGDERHRRRLANQEDELRQHVLQNPQPRRADFRFLGDPSPRPPSNGPYYEPSGQYAMSPTQAQYYPPQITQYPAGSAGPSSLVPQYPQYYAQHPQAPAYMPHPTGPDPSKTTIVGYEMLANQLSRHSAQHQGPGTGMKPVYRRFETLNHRVLLHLQDEISELEEELRYLDECIAQLTEGNPHLPSRRAEARYGGELHFQRTELLGRIYVKLGQYNQGLSSFNKVCALDSASSDEVERYRGWVNQRVPIDKVELQFLDKQADLITVPPKPKAITAPEEEPSEADEETQPAQPKETKTSAQPVDPPVDPAVYPAMLGLTMITMVTLFCFTLLSGTAGRLLVTMIVGVAQAAVIAATQLSDLLPFKEWLMWGSLYFGFMSVLAGLVR